MISRVFTAVLLFTGAASIATAQTQINATIANKSSEFTSLNRLAVHTVDGTGLNASNPPNHDTDPTHMWLNTGDGTFPGGTPSSDPDRPGQLAHITFDLGSTVAFQSIRVWNYNEVRASDGALFVNRGVQTLTISIATAANPTTFVPLIDPNNSSTTWTFAEAPGSSIYTGELFTLTLPATAEFVRFDIKTNYGDPNGLVGLSEVQFFTPAAVPEPSVMALLVFGPGIAVALGRARARRRSTR
jgi:hypothetical protein